MSTILHLTDFEELVLKYLIDQSIEIEDAIVAAMRTNGDIDGETDLSDIQKAIEGIEKKMGDPHSMMEAAAQDAKSSQLFRERRYALLQAAATIRTATYSGAEIQNGLLFTGTEAVLEAEELLTLIESREKERTTNARTDQ